MDKQKSKVNGHIRYDNAFKKGAISICSLKKFRKNFRLVWIHFVLGSKILASILTLQKAKRIREDKLKAAQKQLQQKDEVISILKNPSA